MQEIQSEHKIPKLNYYKILFNKHETLPVGHFSRNLITKIKDPSTNRLTLKEKNMEHFNPISEHNIFKIQKLYTKFQRIKSAKKFSNNPSSRKIMNKLFSRPLSQYSTLIDLSKNTYSNINMKKNYNFRPLSQLGEETTVFMKKILSHNISKIKENKKNIINLKKDKNNNKLYIKKNITKKLREQRSSSAQIFSLKKTLIKEPNIKNLLKHEEEMKQKKKLLKGKLLTALSKHLVINNETIKLYNIIYKNEEKNNDNDDSMRKKNINYFQLTNRYSDYFSKIRPAFRYEDYYFSPMELLKKYFTKDEIIILKSSPGYFGLNKFPFKNSDFAFSPTLLSKFNLEDNKESDSDTHNLVKYNKNEKIKIDWEKEMEKIKNVFKEKKIIKRKKEPIKGKDFVSHYERDIEPDEGTVAYFDRKYLKYLLNKEKKMEKKISYIKFKKSRFEYLKNLRTQKLQEEKNIQRITSPIINVIKKNYLRSNSNLNS